MANGLNQVTLIGNLCADPELRHTQGGTAVLNARLACNERRKLNNEWRDHAEFINVVIWGKRGDGLAGVLSKGKQISVVGKLRTRSYKAKDGGTRYVTEVHADNVVLLGGGEGGQRRQTMEPQHPYQVPQNDDIPF